MRSVEVCMLLTEASDISAAVVETKGAGRTERSF